MYNAPRKPKLEFKLKKQNYKNIQQAVYDNIMRYLRKYQINRQLKIK
jgi:hypothetical protein